MCTLQPGDAIIINTGWGKLWAKEQCPLRLQSCPGIGVKAAEWLIAKDPMLLGSDNTGRSMLSPIPTSSFSIC